MAFKKGDPMSAAEYNAHAKTVQTDAGALTTAVNTKLFKTKSVFGAGEYNLTYRQDPTDIFLAIAQLFLARFTLKDEAGVVLYTLYTDASFDWEETNPGGLEISKTKHAHIGGAWWTVSINLMPGEYTMETTFTPSVLDVPPSCTYKLKQAENTTVSGETIKVWNDTFTEYQTGIPITRQLALDGLLGSVPVER